MTRPLVWSGFRGLLSPRRLGVFALAVCAFLTTAANARGQAADELLSRGRQHVVVVVDRPGDIQGRLLRYRRGDDGWHTVGDAVPVVVGRSGVGPKKEGDGRSPQGIFELGRAFGYAPEPPPNLGLPFQALAPGTVCVDDVESPFYNRILHPSDAGGSASWSSAEEMRRDLAYGDDLYKWGVVVRYNEERRPGQGSCIFFHVWRGPESPTAGCTAMPEKALVELMRWVDPEARPVVVQGSRDYLEGLAEAGTLPYRIPGEQP